MNHVQKERLNFNKNTLFFALNFIVLVYVSYSSAYLGELKILNNMLNYYG